MRERNDPKQQPQSQQQAEEASDKAEAAAEQEREEVEADAERVGEAEAEAEAEKPKPPKVRRAGWRYAIHAGSAEKRCAGAFKKAELPIGSLFAGYVASFDKFGDGAFEMHLREPREVATREGTLVFDTHVTGVLGHHRVVGLEGVSLGEHGAVRHIDAENERLVVHADGAPVRLSPSAFDEGAPPPE